MWNPESTAEVFGGGACKCFYLAGWMKLKEELGIPNAFFLHGCSAGAILAAFIAEGVKYKDLEKYFKKNEFLIKNIFPIDFLSILQLHSSICDNNGYNIDITKHQIANSGWAHTKNLESFLSNFLGNKTFKDRPELEFVAVDWIEKCPIYLNSETCRDTKVREGVMASAAIPMIFPAQKINHNGIDKYAIDGGIIINFPIKRALENKKVKNIFSFTFTDIFPEEKHSKSWLDFLAPTMTLCATCNEKRFMDSVLGENYCDFVEKKGTKKIKYQGKKINLSIQAPKNISKYTFEPNYRNFKELSDRGYNDSKIAFNKLMNLKKNCFNKFFK